MKYHFIPDNLKLKAKINLKNFPKDSKLKTLNTQTDNHKIYLIAMSYYKRFGNNIIYYFKENVEDYFDEIGYK